MHLASCVALRTVPVQFYPACAPLWPFPSQVQRRASQPRIVLLAVCLLAAALQLSAWLYATGTPFHAIFVILGSGRSVWSSSWNSSVVLSCAVVLSKMGILDTSRSVRNVRSACTTHMHSARACIVHAALPGSCISHPLATSAFANAVTVANWALLDGTRQGVALATLCALGAPAAELLLLHFLPLWHYPVSHLPP